MELPGKQAMFEIPLFPLNTVLFPKATLSLHIFEPRYQSMMRLCLEQNRPFGVVLIRQGQEALGPLAEPYSVGCTASIVDHQLLQFGRMNILSVGGERFRLHTIDRQSAPYLVGTCEAWPLQPVGDLDAATQDLRRRLERFITATLAAGGDAHISQLPDHPIELAYLAATLLQISPLQKQQMLELDDPTALLRQIRQLYAREQALLEAMFAPPDNLPGTSFSKN